MPNLKDIDAYVNIEVSDIYNHISFEIPKIEKEELATMYNEVFLEPLTKQTSIRFENPKIEKIDFRLIERHNFCKVSDKIVKKLNIPADRFIVFNNFSGKKGIRKCISSFNFDNNLICYRQEEGSIRSLLHVIRNSLAHGNVFNCHNGILLLSLNKNRKVNGILKISKFSDLLTLIKMLKKEVEHQCK